MEYMGDQEWWNARFGQRGNQLMMHEKLLGEDLSSFPKTGRVLDLACGDGRNSIFLAKQGYDVTAVDFSQTALKRLEQFAKESQLSIQTVTMDLTKESCFEKLEQFELVCINHYRLESKKYHELEKCISSQGILWVNGFYQLPEDNPNVSEGDLLKDSDFESLDNMELVEKKIYTGNGREFVRFLWKKK